MKREKNRTLHQKEFYAKMKKVKKPKIWEKKNMSISMIGIDYREFDS